MSKTKYVEFNTIYNQLYLYYVQLDMLDLLPVKKTVRLWVNNGRKKQTIHVDRNEDGLYCYDDVLTMLKHDYHINLGIIDHVVKTHDEHSQIAQAPYQDKVRRYVEDSNYHRHIDTEVDKVKRQVTLNVLLQLAGYDGFDNERIFNDVLLLDGVKPAEMTTTQQQLKHDLLVGVLDNYLLPKSSSK